MPDANTILTGLLIALSGWTLKEVVSLGKKVARIETKINLHNPDNE